MLAATTAAGNARFEATGSQHDDLVSAISLALWYGEKVCRATLPHVPRDVGDRELTPVSKSSSNAELLEEFLRRSERGWR